MKTARFTSSILALLLVFGLAVFGLRSDQAGASSHREAPMISMDPAADTTDVYAFVSPDKPDTVTIITSWFPFEEPVGGPNFYRFGDDVLYEVHIDNVGDARAHITYQFRFTTRVGNGNTFLYNTGPIENIDSANWNVKQTYTVTRLDDGRPTELGKDLKTPPVNIGPKSTPNYEALSNAAIQQLSDGSTVWAGQSDDPFFVDLNVFDLLTIRKLPGNAGGGVDGLKGYNVHTIALQVPKSRLASRADAVIGVWATASRQATRVLRAGGTSEGSGEWVQVSRLGGVTDPELARLFRALYNIQVPPAPRDDLVAIFLTGIPGATQPPTSTLKPSEQLRLNMGVPPSAQQNRLGVVGGDLAGYPNGRRLADDVTDISLKAVAGAAYPLFHPEFRADPLAAQLGDGVDANDVPFRNAFPYVALPHSGTASVPHGTEAPPAPSCPPAPTCPPAAQPPSAPPSGTMPGMPKTGGLLKIDHLGDVYGIALGALAAVGSLVLIGGWAVRRRAAEEKSES